MSLKNLGILTALGIIALLVIGCGTNDTPTSSDTTDLSLLSAAKAIPADATIDSARIYIYVSDTDTQTVTVHAVTADWDETDVTWTNFAGSFSTDTIGMFDFAESGWYMLDVTEQVQGWFDESIDNFGFFLQYGSEDSATTNIVSREDDENTPYLEICYTVHEGEMCENMETVGDATIFSADPDVNYGEELDLITGGLPDVDSTYGALIEFDFAIEIRYISIGDVVFFDADADGIFDEDEAGIEGVTVNLYDCDDDLLATTVTDAEGMYLFDSLLSGEYKIGFEAPEGYLFSVPEGGMTNCMTILPGVDYLDADAGLYPEPASIGDFVWDDADMNGIQDEGEAGIEGIKVYLFDCEDNLVDSTVTDADGMYMFDEVDAGDYYLAFVNPYGYVFTYQDMGDDDELDSDVDRYQKTTTCFSAAWGEDITGWDAGLFAYDGCTYGKGYWKNHAGFGPQKDELTKLLPIWLGDDDGDKSLAVTDAQTAYNILTQQVYGHPRNGITKLYAHFLTAKLNIVNFANPEEIDGAIADVDAFLADYDWNDWEMLDKDQQKMVLQWKGHLEEYNEGEIGPGHCGDDDDDGYENGYDDGDYKTSYDYEKYGN